MNATPRPVRRRDSDDVSGPRGPAGRDSIDVAPFVDLADGPRESARMLLASLLGEDLSAGSAAKYTLIALDADTSVLGVVQVAGESAGSTIAESLREVAPEVIGGVEISSVVVQPSARRQGVARRLVESAEAAIRARGRTFAWAAAWVHEDGTSPGSEMFTALGYELRGHIDLYWFQEGASVGPGEPDAICPDCGAPCRCIAAIFVKDLSRSPDGAG